ncbi:MAG: 5-oxoprolinase subunit PxpA [Bacteroidia bacterium]|nr:5-oxoprolinase subunit PxpA [Bacteroidia bacterium]
MGESFGAWTLGHDESLMPYIHAANIACGFHAGDPGGIRRTVQSALRHGIKLGAHPGLPDLQGFGRREMSLSPTEAYDLTLYQVSALRGIVSACGGRLYHVKPHGALYNMAARQPELAQAIARAVADLDPSLVMMGLSGSALVAAGEAAGLRVLHEVFADRTYQPDGSLTPRSHPHALIEDTTTLLTQAEDLVLRQQVRTLTGAVIPLRADTLCIHGDGVHAQVFAEGLFRRFGSMFSE